MYACKLISLCNPMHFAKLTLYCCWINFPWFSTTGYYNKHHNCKLYLINELSFQFWFFCSLGNYCLYGGLGCYPTVCWPQENLNVFYQVYNWDILAGKFSEVLIFCNQPLFVLHVLKTNPTLILSITPNCYLWVFIL